MKPLTERLLQIAAIVVLLWFGWTLAKESIVWNLQLSSRVTQLEQALTACREAKK